MERRSGMRKAVDVDVVIDNQPVRLVRGRIDNISVGGVFVRTEAANLQKNTPVELVLMLKHEHATRIYRMPAVVVRLAGNGAGLMFDQYDVNAFRALVVLLLAQREAAVPRAVKDPAGRHFFSVRGGTSVAPVLEGRSVPDRASGPGARA